MWEEDAFEFEFDVTRVLTRHVAVCNSPASVQFAFSLKHSTFERKSAQMRHALAPLLGDGLFVSDGETWRARRNIVTPIVHVSQLSHFAPAIVGSAADLRERWASSDGDTLDILAESAALTADVICRALFGQELTQAYARQIVDGFTEYQQYVDQVDVLSLFGFPDWVPRWRRGALRRATSRIQATLDEIIDQCRARSDSEPSAVGRLLNARDDRGHGLSQEALRNEVIVLFMAGHETTANCLAWTWYLLSQVPDVEARFHEEINRVLGGRLPAIADVPCLVYTRAIIEEALRLYPPIPILSREAMQDQAYEGHRIPKGSLVLVIPWLLHRHRKLWDRPDHFIPDRFLPGAEGRISKFAYVPFSVGPRVCAGLSFGLTEAILCLATLAQGFQLRLKDGYEVMPVARLSLRPAGGLPMTIHARDRKLDERPADFSSSARCPVA